MAAEEEFTALPQRAPRHRGRTVKKAKLEEHAAGEVQAGNAPPPADQASGLVEPAPATAAAAATGGAEPQGQQQAPHAPNEQQAEGPEEDVTPAHSQLELPKYRSAAVRGHKFEYLDHTADVQLHAWGSTLAEAFENVALCMFNYMTPLKGISIDSALTRQYEAEGHDLQSLLFNFLDELLFAFSTEFFVAKQLHITNFDRDNWRIEAEGQGERFDRQRHACGTEIKAITYSAMQINEKPGDAEVFVIVDI